MNENNNERTIEKLLLGLLMFITVTQFAVWGQQSMTYILTTIFPVADPVANSFLDLIIGFGAMIASALVFAGSVMWWKQITKAFDFIKIGAIVFMVKNALDIINEIIIFAKVNVQPVTMSEINTLAAGLGEQFFQLAFWVFVLYFFRFKINSFIHRLDNMAPIPANNPTPQ